MTAWPTVAWATADDDDRWRRRTRYATGRRARAGVKRQVMAAPAHLLLGAALAAGGCAAEPPQQQATDRPSLDVRYGPVSVALCDAVDLAGILRDVGATIGETRFSGWTDEQLDSGDEHSLLYADCRFRIQQNDFLFRSQGGEVSVFVTEDPDHARRGYDYDVDSARRWVAEQEPRTWASAEMQPVEGWWTKGTYTEEFEDAGAPSGVLRYYIYDENLYMTIYLQLSFQDSALEKGTATSIAHDLAQTLIEAAIRVVPCEALGDAPPPIHCGRHGSREATPSSPNLVPPPGEHGEGGPTTGPTTTTPTRRASRIDEGALRHHSRLGHPVGAIGHRVNRPGNSHGGLLRGAQRAGAAA